MICPRCNKPSDVLRTTEPVCPYCISQFEIVKSPEQTELDSPLKAKTASNVTLIVVCLIIGTLFGFFLSDVQKPAYKCIGYHDVAGQKVMLYTK